MEQVRSWWLLAVALGLLIAAACSRAVPGTPSADAPGARGPIAGSPSGGPPTPATRDRAPTLESEVLADECLLDATQLGALLDRPLRVEQAVVHRADGTLSSSCYAATRDAPAAPVAAINVYRVRSGTPAEWVRAAGGRPLATVGEAAALLETAAGPTLQVAGPAFLVTLAVHGRSPPDDAWRSAARAALARLPA